MLQEFKAIYSEFSFQFINEAEFTLISLDIKIGQSIFQNLFLNAIKYSRERKEIIVKLINPDNKTIVVEIKDFGVGIPTEYKNNIFDNFVRAHNVEYIQGTGLGLSIVKKSVELHKGRIFFTSNENEGTSFFVSLPISI
jgi:signal transduction histidine kinase